MEVPPVSPEGCLTHGYLTEGQPSRNVFLFFLHYCSESSQHPLRDVTNGRHSPLWKPHNVSDDALNSGFWGAAKSQMVLKIVGFSCCYGSYYLLCYSHFTTGPKKQSFLGFLFVDWECGSIDWLDAHITCTRPWGSIPSTTQTWHAWMHAYNLSTWDMEAGGSGIQGHSCLHSKLKASLGCVRCYFKENLFVLNLLMTVQWQSGGWLYRA